MNKELAIIAVLLLIVTGAVLYYTTVMQTAPSTYIPQKQTESTASSQPKEATSATSPNTGSSPSSNLSY